MTALYVLRKISLGNFSLLSSHFAHRSIERTKFQMPVSSNPLLYVFPLVRIYCYIKERRVECDAQGIFNSMIFRSLVYKTVVKVPKKFRLT